mgnify:CR=1 FL=1
MRSIPVVVNPRQELCSEEYAPSEVDTRWLLVPSIMPSAPYEVEIRRVYIQGKLWQYVDERGPGRLADLAHCRPSHGR